MRAVVWLTNASGIFRCWPRRRSGLRLVIDGDQLWIGLSAQSRIAVPLKIQCWEWGPWWYVACSLERPAGYIHLLCRRASPEAIRFAHQLARAQ